VPEIQFGDYVYPAFDQIVNELAKFRYRRAANTRRRSWCACRSAAASRAGTTTRSRRGVLHAHPGREGRLPVEPVDAKGLLASAIRGEDPVIFMEPKRLLPRVEGRRPRPANTPIPLGEAAWRAKAGR
jgi:2-oxoisovalerate dehydrogenase E1 component beta subunit